MSKVLAGRHLVVVDDTAIIKLGIEQALLVDGQLVLGLERRRGQGGKRYARQDSDSEGGKLTIAVLHDVSMPFN